MRKIIVATIVAALSITVTAGAKPGDPPLKRERAKYTRLYNAVRAKDGKRAPGRQIVKWGVRHRHTVRPATAREVARSIRQLRLLLHPMLVARPPAQAPAAVQTARAGSTLNAIGKCESGGNYATNTGNGFYGKYQFTDSTWHAMGGTGHASDASPAEQDQRAAALYAQQGPSPWPVCGR